MALPVSGLMKSWSRTATGCPAGWYSTPPLAYSLTRLAVDLDVQRRSDIGLPRVSGWTSSSRAASSSGWVSVIGFTPAPGALTRSDGSMPASTSETALITVLRLMPAASATIDFVPGPHIPTAAPTTMRRWRSFRWGRTTSKNRASASGPTSTAREYIARVIQRRTLRPTPRSQNDRHLLSHASIIDRLGPSLERFPSLTSRNLPTSSHVPPNGQTRRGVAEHTMKLLLFRRGMAFPGDPPTDIHS